MAILCLVAMFSVYVSMPTVRADSIDINILPEPKDDMEVTVTEDIGYDSLHRLNRVNFNSTLEHSGISDWIVFYCTSWWVGCQHQISHYRALAVPTEAAVNTALLSKQVRFAVVDCAVDKPLCNEQGVYNYPWTVHYHKGQQNSVWVDYVKNAMFEKWIDETLAGKSEGEEVEETISQITATVVLESLKDTKSFRGANFIILCVAIGINMRLVLRSLFPDTATEASPKTFQVGEPSSDLGNCIPREWSRDRSSLEL
jgi:hypothetical protein